MEKQKYYFIYQTTNKINGKIYIGKHETYDLNDGYLGSGKYLNRAIEKYGIKNFERKILFFCESEDEMNAKEKEIVNEEFVARKDTYNLKVGGDGGWDFVNDPNNNIVKGFQWINIHGLNHKSNQHLKNKHHLEIDPSYKKEFSKKLSIGLKRHKLNNPSWQKGMNNPMFGKKHSIKTKEKLSIANKGSKSLRFKTHWWKDPNDKSKSLAIKEGDPVPEGWIRGRWASDEQRKKNSISAKNRKWYHNPITHKTKYLKENSIEEQNYIMLGWIKGRK